jgi:hypothetical protein
VGRHSGNEDGDWTRAGWLGRAGGDERATINPLLFVDWSAVSSMFRGLMWIVALVLAAVIMVHLVPTAPEAHHAARLIR